MVRERIKEIGYIDEKKGLNFSNCDIILCMTHKTAPEKKDESNTIKDEEIVSKEITTVFGYATDETPEFMPQSQLLASKIAEKLTEYRKSKGSLRPDGKVVVTMEYKSEDKTYIPVRVHSVVVTTQHDSEKSCEDIKNTVIENVIKPVIPKELSDNNTQYIVNPSGSFVVSTVETETGLSGKKLNVDTYGGWAALGSNQTKNKL